MTTNETIWSNLQKIGFSEKEARVYSSCLALGTANMTTISRHAELKRSNTYFIVESLIQRGYLFRIQKGKIDYFKAGNPETIIFEQIERTRIAEQTIPFLKQLSTQNIKTEVRYCEGKKQVELVYDELFRSKELWSLVYLDQYWKLFGEDHNRHLYELLKRNGGLNHILIPNTRRNIEFANQKYRTGLQEVKLLPLTFQTQEKVGISLNKSVVICTSYETVVATVIKDPNIVSVIKQMWLSLWNQSSPLINETNNET